MTAGRTLGLALAGLSLLLLALGAAVGSNGLDNLLALRHDPITWQIVWDIRLPRTLGAWCVGALLGLGGAVAQGLFRNPLADPYLLGSASGASLGVVLVLAAGTVAGQGVGLASAGLLLQLGLATAAFIGAWLGVALTLLLAQGAQQTTRLLLAGVVVGVVMSAVSDLLTTLAPEALQGKQAFMLGSTGFIGWGGLGLLLLGLLLTVPLAWRLSRVLDALTLGEDSARSLGLPLSSLRMLLVSVMALSTGLAVSQSGLVAFVGLVSPHLVRRFAPGPHGFSLLASAGMGGTLLLAADVLARGLVAPQELPVGVLTAVLGGGYLLWLLHRRRPR